MIWVRSIGKPKVSYSLNASSPGISRGPGREDLLEPPESAVDGLQEAVLLGLGHLADVPCLGRELGIDVAHGGHHHLGERRQRRLPPAEQPGVANGAAQNAAQHVAPALVARIDAVGQQEAHRPRVVRQHAVGRAVVRVAIVRRGPPARRPGRSAAGRRRCGSCRPRPAGPRRSARGPPRCPPTAWAAASACRRPSGRTA